MKRVATLVAIALFLASTAAEGVVRRMSLTTPVQAGDLAALTVNVSPRARCSITVTYNGVVARTRGLVPRAGRRITWRWRVDANTKPGRWPIVVRCGSSGTLRTKLKVLAAKGPEMSLNDASIAMCTRAPARVMARYNTELEALNERALASLRRKVGEFNCGYGIGDYPGDGAGVGYWVASISPGGERCSFVISARVIWFNARPYSNYAGPPERETYTETCKSLRR